MTTSNNSSNNNAEKYKIVRGTEGYTSKLVAVTSFRKGDVLEYITESTPAVKRYTTVQVSDKEHIELNSDVVYLNHSCAPNCIMDVKNMLVRLTKDVQAGEELTFFYPSTEWDMDQPFRCWCKSADCIENVRGAKYLPKDALDKYFFNDHILSLYDRYSK